MYVAGSAHKNREPALRFLRRVRNGSVDACTSTEVLQEILYRYSALGRRDLAGRVYDNFVDLCPAVLPITLAETDRARVLLTANDRLSARDAIHAAVMLNNDISQIATFDKAFDAVGGVERVGLR